MRLVDPGIFCLKGSFQTLVTCFFVGPGGLDSLKDAHMNPEIPAESQTAGPEDLLGGLPKP